MKVLVTGATGFIGAHTVTRLLQGGHDVAALTRTSAPALERAGMKAVRGDVADPADVLRAMAGCEALMHLANVYSFWERDPRIYWRINVEATRGVLDGPDCPGILMPESCPSPIPSILLRRLSANVANGCCSGQ